MQNLMIALLLGLIPISFTLNAQDKKEQKDIQKVIVIQKIDNEGNVTEERFESDGPEFSDDVRQKLKTLKMTMIDTNIDNQIKIEIQREGNPMNFEQRPERMKLRRDNAQRWKMQKERAMDRALSAERNAPSATPSLPENQAVLGIAIDDTDNGVLVTEIVAGSAAEAAGLRRGDILLKVNKSYVFTSNGLLKALNPFNPGEKIKLRYIRDGNEKSTSVILKARK